MKFEGFVDAQTASALCVDWLVAELEPVSDYGRTVFQRLVPFSRGEETQAAARATMIADLARSLDVQRIDAVRDVLRSVPDAGGAFARASMGDTLSDVNLLEVQRFCDAIARIEGLLRDHPHLVPARCSAIAASLERGRAGKFGFYVTDAFDATLAEVRAEFVRAQADLDAARRHLGARLGALLGREDPGTDEFIIMREDLRGPVPAGIHVIREAPTYLLCELELDEPALTALRRRDDVAARVAAAEESVRAGLSAVVSAGSTELEAAARALGDLDVLMGAVRFALRYACNVAIYVEEPRADFEAAHFLPLQSELEQQARPYTPVSVDLQGAAILTGPNMGGKSVALQTCGFIAVCASFGLPVPAKRASVPLFERIAWLGIGMREEMGGLLSSFAREVVRLRDALADSRAPALFLIDEFARTTTPDEGRALLLALIDRLERDRICAFVATHLSGIAQASGATHFAVRGLRGIPHVPPADDLQVALASLAASMDYTIERVTGDGQATGDAIFLAGLLGMDEDFVEKAREAHASGEVRPPPKRSKNP